MKNKKAQNDQIPPLPWVELFKQKYNLANHTKKKVQRLTNGKQIKYCFSIVGWNLKNVLQKLKCQIKSNKIIRHVALYMPLFLY